MQEQITEVSTKRHLLVAVIGSSDVQGADLDPEGHDARRYGETLLEKVNLLGAGTCGTYRCPLLEPLIAMLTEQQQRPEHIVLIGTDQQDPLYRDTDTLHYAELVKVKLVATVKFAEAEIETEPYYNSSPVDYDETFKWMRQRFAHIGIAYPPVETICHLAITGGTQALTTALLVEGIAVYGSNTKVHYQLPTKNAPLTFQIVEDFQAQTLKRRLLALIDAHAYAAAGMLCDEDAVVFETLLPDDDHRSQFRALLNHGSERLNANLKEARDILSTVSELLTKDECHALALLPDGAGEQASEDQRLREILASAEVMFGQKHYFDFVTRVGTFIDTCLMYVARFCFGDDGAQPSPDDPQKPGTKVTLEPWITNNKPLVEYLKANEEKKNREIRVSGPPTQMLLGLIIAFLTTKHPEREPLRKMLADGHLVKIAELRNSNVHRFGEITADLLTTVWVSATTKKSPVSEWGATATDILPSLRKIAQQAGAEAVDSTPYTTLQGALKRILQ